MYEDFKVKTVKEEDCIVVVRFPMAKNTIAFVTWDGLQFMMPDDPEKNVFVGKPDNLSQGKAVFHHCRQHIPGVKEVVEVKELNPYHLAVYQTEASEAVTRKEKYIRTRWERVSISDILEYIDRIGEHADFYGGVSEMGYDDIFTIAANWNPPKMKKLCDWIDKFFQGNISIEWSDEWTGCCNCYKAVRTSADSYGWQTSWVWTSDCEMLCHECVKNDGADDVIEHYLNSLNKALPYWMQEHVEAAGFKCLESEESYCTRFENGFHRGQDDTPKKCLKLAKKILPYKFDHLFLLTDVGQFDIHWAMFVRKVEVEEEVEN